MKNEPRLNPMNTRRRFLQTAATGAVLGPCALTLAPHARGAEIRGLNAAFPNFAKGEVVRTSGQLVDGRFVEAGRAIPVAGRSQVLVCGAGPAGIGAAIAAARAGADTQLIESAGCLGGVWTAGLLTKIMDGTRKPGIMREILQAMVARGSDIAKKSKGEIYDPELMKVVLEEMCVAAGVKIRLHTQLVGAVTDSRNRLIAAITESKSGRKNVRRMHTKLPFHQYIRVDAVERFARRLTHRCLRWFPAVPTARRAIFRSAPLSNRDSATHRPW